MARRWRAAVAVLVLATGGCATDVATETSLAAYDLDRFGEADQVELCRDVFRLEAALSQTRPSPAVRDEADAAGQDAAAYLQGYAERREQELDRIDAAFRARGDYDRPERDGARLPLTPLREFVGSDPEPNRLFLEEQALGCRELLRREAKRAE